MKLLPFHFLFVFLLACLSKCFSQAFFDNNGKAILFYNQSKNVLFDYSGTPKFYFTFDNLNKINLYDFEGHHIAWLSEGIIRDHEGRILASQKARIVNVNYTLEPIKPIEKIIPIKKIQEIPPIQPLFTNQFSSNSLLGISNSINSSQSTSVYSKNDYSATVTYGGYDLPKDAIMNALQALNQRHNQLIANGYIYDTKTGNYYTKEQYAAIESKRKAISNSFYDVINEAKNSNQADFNFKNPKKKTWYWAYFGHPELGVFSAKILIKKSGKIRGFYFTHPQYGNMFFGLYGKPKINFPYTDVSFVGDISKFNRREVGLLGSSYLKGRGTLFWHRGLIKTSN